MTYFHYYATTTRNLADVFKYFVYPMSQALGCIIAQKCGCTDAKRFEVGAQIARYTGAGLYMGLSSAFFGLESQMIDDNCRDAVAAELGIKPEELKFSDLRKSDNIIAKKAYHDILNLQKYRFGTDALFILPELLKPLGTAAGVKMSALEFSEREIRDGKTDKSAVNPAEIFFNGHNAWAGGVYAAKAAYWAGETYAIKKTGHYEVVKLRENLESTGKDVSANDILAIYQRSRQDAKLPMIDKKEEFDAVRPLLKKMAEAYNKRTGFGVPEIVYLIGLGKVNIFAADGKTISQQAIDNSLKEIETIQKIGLSGIRNKSKESLKEKPKMHIGHYDSFVDRVADTAFGAGVGIRKLLLGEKKNARPEEYVSVRDPGDIINLDFSVNR